MDELNIARIQNELAESAKTAPTDDVEIDLRDMPVDGMVFVSGSINGCGFNASASVETFIDANQFEAFSAELRTSALLNMFDQMPKD